MTITLIIPIFNVEKYIKECLSSIIDQTVSFDEVILVDDGSTDNSYCICKEYSDKFSNIFLIHQENQGQGRARNIGMDLASSDYIMFCDADDYLDVHLCEKMHQICENEDIEAVLFDAFCVYEDGFGGKENPYDRSWILYGDLMTGEEYFVTTYPKMHVVSPCLMILKRDFLMKNHIEFPVGVFYEDNVFFIKILLRIERLKYIPEKLYYRRYRHGSTINSAISEKKMNDKVNIIKQMHEVLFEEVLKKGSGMLMYLSYYWNLYGDFLYECSYNKELLDKQRWGKIIYEYYKESRKVLTEKLNIEGTISILGEQCLILYFLKRLNIYIDDVEYQTLRNRYKEKIINLLEKLPLQSEKAVVGIYGTGKHTDCLLEVYEAFVGKIKCKIVYLETKTERKKIYRKHQVYCVEDRINELSIVIISSFRYQEVMINKLKNIDANVEILTLYDKNEAREINWKFVLEE